MTVEKREEVCLLVLNISPVDPISGRVLTVLTMKIQLPSTLFRLNFIN